jgi:uncharacterized protein (DUF427 family)
MTEATYRFAARIPEGVEPVVPGPGEESVWDFPRPPRVEPVAERVRVVVDGIAIADTTRAMRVLETAGAPVYYVPRMDVRADVLRRATRTTACEWKGAATYWSLATGRRQVTEIAWSYDAPLPGYEAIRGHMAFYAGLVDEAWVGEDQAVPQPGGYYGGWLTPRVVGPVKGGPGSFGW